MCHRERGRGATFSDHFLSTGISPEIEEGNLASRDPVALKIFVDVLETYRPLLEKGLPIDSSPTFREADDLYRYLVGRGRPAVTNGDLTAIRDRLLSLARNSSVDAGLYRRICESVIEQCIAVFRGELTRSGEIGLAGLRNISPGQYVVPDGVWLVTTREAADLRKRLRLPMK